ncbi:MULTISPECIES: hypothetical protein [Pseudomonas]|uniref:hypothetical protein n=1 Tax=Pseudomonas TaxID=286 RepID=UPI00301C7B8C
MQKPVWADARLYNAGSETTPQTGTRPKEPCSGGGFYWGPRYNFGDLHEIKRFWQASRSRVDMKQA